MIQRFPEALTACTHRVPHTCTDLCRHIQTHVGTDAPGRGETQPGILRVAPATQVCLTLPSSHIRAHLLLHRPAFIVHPLGTWPSPEPWPDTLCGPQGPAPLGGAPGPRAGFRHGWEGQGPGGKAGEALRQPAGGRQAAEAPLGRRPTRTLG